MIDNVKHLKSCIVAYLLQPGSYNSSNYITPSTDSARVV